MRSTQNRDMEQRQSIPAAGGALPLDLETAPDLPGKPLGYRAYVGGVLYIEGLVVLLMGTMLLTSYWPPVSAFGRPANPVSRLGLWMAGGALCYMVVVGVGIFLYNLWRPGRLDPRLVDNRSIVVRARRYASMKKRTRYIFDNTICCERDAEEAMRARDMY